MDPDAFNEFWVCFRHLCILIQLPDHTSCPYLNILSKSNFTIGYLTSRILISWGPRFLGQDGGIVFWRAVAKLHVTYSFFSDLWLISEFSSWLVSLQGFTFEVASEWNGLHLQMTTLRPYKNFFHGKGTRGKEQLSEGQHPTTGVFVYFTAVM